VARALCICATERRKQLVHYAQTYVVPAVVRNRWLDSIAAVRNAQREGAPALVRLGLSANGRIHVNVEEQFDWLATAAS
jgi:hypothetical protein